ncbi:MAG: hypothetical protein KDB32_11825 [Planctomycetes bacterium]|nr:hypothetical protein [Planctomycetota bacterium]MCA8946391.1 hypothetical protein [Planctomycetota bacterium]
MKIALLVALACLLSAPMFAEESTTDPESQPAELGLVHWYRNVDTGIELAKDSGKPIFLQFQEVPG